MTDDEIAELRRTAENPLARPSERVDARRKLVEAGAVPPRRMGGRERQDAMSVARAMLREMGFE